jgi:transcription antitermination protein NusB
MSARSKARKRAIDLLYEADMRDVGVAEVLAGYGASADRPLNPYTVEAVEGVAANQARIDEILSGYSDGWTIARMPSIDRAILRLGIYELAGRDDVPSAVAIDEAVELAKTLSTDESPRFINGVLAAVLRDAPPLHSAS